MITLPWTPRMAPHVVLEINDVCNITCAGCYKAMTGTEKTVEQVLGDLDIAQKQRRVQTVSLAGGETTLHSGLSEIVGRIHARGLKTAILTNGVALSDERLTELKKAGLDLVQLHIDEGQRRPDLPENPSLVDIHELRDRIAANVARHGMDAGLSVTLYPNPIESLAVLVEYVIASPAIHFLFASHYFNPESFAVALERRDTAWRPDTTNESVLEALREGSGLEPFACFRGNNELGDVPGWLTYLVPVLHQNKQTARLRIRSTRADMWPFLLMRALSGHYVFYCKPKSVALVVQVLLNGLCNGRLGQAVGFLKKGLRRGAKIGCKRMVFDNGPRVLPDGRTECANLCPNATVRDGQLCGICTADIVKTT